MLLKLAWRNLWRNRRRTVISVAALTLGVFAIVSLHSFREVSYDAMFRAITDGLIGDVQVHARGYQETPTLERAVADVPAVVAAAARALPAAQVERRVIGAGLAGVGEAASPAMVMGIEPAATRGLTVAAGRTLAAAPAREALLGTGLAAELGVAPGGEVVLVGQAADGSLANDRYTVVGTVDAGTAEANAAMVVLHLTDAQSFFSLGAGVHQIVLRIPPGGDARAASAALRGAVDPATLEVLAWQEILPDLLSAVEAKRRNMGMVDVIIFLIVSLGVWNTMTMSTFERTREFGVMRSLGTRPGRVVGLVALEAVLQGLIGFVIGVVLAWGLLHAYGTIDFSSWGGDTDVMGARLPDGVRLVVHGPSLLAAAVTTMLTVLAGALLPAIRAARLKPVEATRYV